MMDPTTYHLFEGTPFVVPIDPGAMAIYPQWVAPTTIKMIDVTFLPHDKNYFLSYKNIARVCFCMFDANNAAQFKVFNTPLLTGWNSTMTIIKFLDQSQDSYGKPNMMMLFNNDTLFWSPMTSGNSPEMPSTASSNPRRSSKTGRSGIWMIKLLPLPSPLSSRPTCSHSRSLMHGRGWPTKGIQSSRTSFTKCMGNALWHWSSVARQGRMDTPARQCTTSLRAMRTPGTTL
jgi:hypothetical protein